MYWGGAFYIERFNNLLIKRKVMERNELEKRLENESVHDTLMDIHSQLNLDVKGFEAIHDLNKMRDTIILSSYSFSNKFTKDIYFSELKEKDKKNYESILNTITDALNDYPVKI